MAESVEDSQVTGGEEVRTDETQFSGSEDDYAGEFWDSEDDEAIALDADDLAVDASEG